VSTPNTHSSSDEEAPARTAQPSACFAESLAKPNFPEVSIAKKRTVPYEEINGLMGK
jgi:hypothetical protein